jgi:amino acid transporter
MFSTLRCEIFQSISLKYFFLTQKRIFSFKVPAWLHGYHPWDTTGTGFFSLSLLSVVIIIICTAILLLGAKESALFNKIITVLNLAVLLFIIIVGSTRVNTANWENFFPFGVRGVFQGAGQVFFAYIGFDSVTTLASESANPKRDLPLGVIITLGIATALYIAVSLVLTGMLNYQDVSKDAPLSNAFFSIGLPWAGGIVAAISVTTLMATTLASLLSQPRIFMQMAQDVRQIFFPDFSVFVRDFSPALALQGLFFSPFKTVNSRQVPLFGTIVTGLLAAILAFAINLDALADMISIGTLLAFYVVCGGIIVTRLTPQPGMSADRTSLSCYDGVLLY